MSDLHRERLARLALSWTREPGDAWLARSITEIGAVDLHDHLRSGRRHTGIAADVAARLAEIDPALQLVRAERMGLRYVVPGDEEWPTQVEDLAHAEPLAGTGGCPVGLWVRGPRRLQELGRSIAVVGSRSATSYGCDVAAQLATGAAFEGWSVVSGGAFGIDIAAHRGALAVEGHTVAVLACGADRAYPLAHEQLIEHLAAGSSVVSETIPGGAPLKARFLSRNRLIAALTRGTVVVEAALRSGALNTATWASRINRPLMGVPGPVTSATSQGVHALVRSGQASLVTSARDVLEVVASSGEHLATEARGPERPHDRLTRAQQRILEAVPARRAATATSIARAAGVRVEHAEAALVELAGSSLVEPVGTGWRLARRPQEAAMAT